MNELIPTQQNESNEILVTGRDLHGFLEVKTKYADWITRMIDYGFSENVDYITKFEPTQKREGSRMVSRPTLNHHIKLDMAKEISMLQRNEKGKQARQYFIEVEKKWNSPEMIVQRAMEIQQRKVLELEQTIEEQKPKVLYADAVKVSKDTVLVKELANILKKEGVNIGTNRLFEWLRENGFLCKRKGEMRNTPTQKSLDLGIMVTKLGLRTDSDGEIKHTRTPKVTGKGQVYFVNKFLEVKELV